MSAHDDLLASWESDFRTTHAADAANAKRQPFAEYWNWVKTFLVDGGAGQRGWLAQGDEVLRSVRDRAFAAELRERMLSLGKEIAAEWAKDSRARRVHSTFLQGSPNLQDWGKQLQRAAAAETGDGAAIEAALERIDRELNAARKR